MKKITLLLVMITFVITCFSQNYIGKSKGYVIFNSSFVYSSDSTDILRKEGVYSYNEMNSVEDKVIIHDTENNKITTCYFGGDIESQCVGFDIVFYNISKPSLKNKLTQKYEYYGEDSWVLDLNGEKFELCLTWRDDSIYILEACQYLVNYE